MRRVNSLPQRSARASPTAPPRLQRSAPSRSLSATRIAPSLSSFCPSLVLLHSTAHAVRIIPSCLCMKLYSNRSPFRLAPSSLCFASSFSTASANDTKIAATKPAPTLTRSAEEAQAMWWRAVELGSTDDALEVIDEAGVDSQQDATRRTALHIASLKRTVEARVDIEDAQGFTAVDYAVRSGNQEIARLLLGWQLVLKGDEMVGRILRRSYHLNPASVQQNLLSSALPKTADAVQAEFGSAVCNGELFQMHLLWFFSGHPVSLDASLGSLPLLFHALKRGDNKVLRFLLDMGANVNVYSPDRVTPIDAAVDLSNIGALSALQKASATAGLDSALLRASSAKTKSDIMIRKLIEMGASPKSTAPDGATGLHFAASNGDASATDALLKGGGLPNARTKNGATPLFYAAMGGNVGVMRPLLESGASAALANENGWTPLFVAAHEGHAAAVQLLLSFNDNVNSVAQVSAGLVASPLFAAAMNGHADAARLLLESGADINGPKTEGSLPPLVAALPHPAVMILLLSRGASPNLRFPAVLLGSEDSDLETSPLAWAAREGNAGLVRILLEHGADPKMTELAEQGQHSEVIQLLRRASSPA